MKNPSLIHSHELKRLITSQDYGKALDYITEHKKGSEYPPSFWDSAERIIHHKLSSSKTSLQYQPGPTPEHSLTHGQADPRQSLLWDEAWYIENYYAEYRRWLESQRASQRLDTSPFNYYFKEGWKKGHLPSAHFWIHPGKLQGKGCPLTYFLSNLRFSSFLWERNTWPASEQEVLTYNATKKKRAPMGVVYTCITCDYDAPINHYHINHDWDYVCFTDNPKAMIAGNPTSIWEFKALAKASPSSTLTNRWHKLHPHILFPTQEKSIYIDGNINVISPYLFSEVIRRQQPILIPSHFERQCVYEELSALMASPRFSTAAKKIFADHKNHLEEIGFPKNIGLTENNIIFRTHHTPLIISIMEDWWKATQITERDQITLPQALLEHSVTPKDIFIRNTRVFYTDFWPINHGQSLKTHLLPAFASNLVALGLSTNEYFSDHAGVALKSLITNTSHGHNYDIVIFHCDLSDASIFKLRAVVGDLPNVCLRFYNMTEVLQSVETDLLYVEGYVPRETYNKCFLQEILKDYRRFLYLDTDIVVLDDIAKLYHEDLEGMSLGACLNHANINAAKTNKSIKGKPFGDYLKKSLHIENPEHYTQIGVILLDLEKLNSTGRRLLSESMQALREVKEPIFFDQCIFNKIFNGDTKFISEKWNSVWYLQKFSFLRSTSPAKNYYEFARSRIAPSIIHYSSKDKPQHKPSMCLASFYWNYAQQLHYWPDLLVKNLNEMSPEEAKYLEANLPRGLKKMSKVLAHLHIYYIDQLHFFATRINSCKDIITKLYVTIPDTLSEYVSTILGALPNADIHTLPNCGYDIYPFLECLYANRTDEYDYILKLHTKNQRKYGQDVVYGTHVPGFKWRNMLVDSLIGDPVQLAENIRILDQNKDVGMIGCRSFIFSIHDNNEVKNYNLEDWMHRANSTGATSYVGGSMFLARYYPFEKIKALNLKAKDFSSNILKTKDCKNLAHSIERLCGLCVESDRFRILGVEYREPC